MHQCEVPAEGGINPLHSMEIFHSDILHSQEIYTHMDSMMPGISFRRVQKPISFLEPVVVPIPD